MDIFLEEFMAGWREMPSWAQIGVSFFALTAVVMFVEPIVRRRRAAANLTALARAAGATVHRQDAYTAWFTLTVDGRPFEVRRDYRVRGKGSSYRGPTGHLLVTSTPLAGSRWQMHQVDVLPFRLPRFLRPAALTTGDAAFDDRFVVTEDGLPVRDGWLDATTRAAVTTFFDLPAATGRVWVREQRLHYLADFAWRGLDLATLTARLQRQAMLAGAFERTSGWRGPAA
jgi:hypothetical protein